MRTSFARLGPLFVVFAVLLAAGMPGAAYAETITCGSCHSTPPVDADNCMDDARGLHGTHTNYSSASYPETVANYGKCAYCHTAVTDTVPTTTHNNSYINITSTATAPGLDFDSGTATCVNACHKNDATTAKWGNYTAVDSGVALACNACHDDSSSSPVIDLSGAHSAHLQTALTVTGLGNGTNADCASCHPDNTNDLWSGGMADDGTVKAYPHASDGTNVVSANATTTVGFSGAGCTSACHTNSSTDVWGASQLTCNSCHYYEASPSSANNNASNVPLSCAHNSHFDMGKVCSDCHTVPSAGDTAHATALPVSQDNATVTLATGTWTDSTNTCSNTGAGCHLSSSAIWCGWSDTCSMCHYYPGVSSDWPAGNGHAVRYDTAVVTNTHLPLTSAFNEATDTYAAVTADASKCGKCHSGGTHQNGTIDMAGNGYNYCGAGDFTIVVNVSGSDATCSNVSCHNGKSTPNWY